MNKVFIFEQRFTYIIKQFIRVKEMNMHDIATIYFISPYDLIVDYHSYGSKFPMADFFVAITQYRFHSDINYNIKKGNFEFITSAKILNTIKLVKKTLLAKTIINESNQTNKNEIENNIWPYFKEVIKNADKINQEKINDVFENHLKKTLNNYSKEKNKEFLHLYNEENHSKDIDYLNNNEIILNFNKFINEEKDDYNKNVLRNKIKAEKKYKKSNKRKILKYGVFFVFTLFIIRLILSIIREKLSFETFFYILLIFIIGYILIRLNTLKKSK